MSKRRGSGLDVRKLVKKLLACKANQQVSVTQRELMSLCDKVQDVFQREETLLEISVPIKIVGDIHGQFGDLRRWFKENGLPPEQRYLFLGDYVDRGRQGIETIALLFAFKVLYPNKIYLLRGNHECKAITRVYGFYHEIQERFSLALWRRFCTVFDHMSLSALIDKRILCMHGGISPHLHDLDQIRSIKKPDDIPDAGLACDILWADPSPDIKHGWGESDRGISFIFSSKVVREFSKQMQLDLIVRAHQVVPDGYQFFAGRHLVTIFSAPNYCGDYENTAAILSIDANFEISFCLHRPSSSIHSVISKK